MLGRDSFTDPGGDDGQVEHLTILDAEAGMHVVGNDRYLPAIDHVVGESAGRVLGRRRHAMTH